MKKNDTRISGDEAILRAMAERVKGHEAQVRALSLEKGDQIEASFEFEDGDGQKKFAYKATAIGSVILQTMIRETDGDWNAGSVLYANSLAVACYRMVEAVRPVALEAVVTEHSYLSDGVFAAAFACGVACAVVEQGLELATTAGAVPDAYADESRSRVAWSASKGIRLGQESQVARMVGGSKTEQVSARTAMTVLDAPPGSDADNRAVVAALVGRADTGRAS